jgi:phage terminase Nu1 subunit (DNA packaging protein)
MAEGKNDPNQSRNTIGELLTARELMLRLKCSRPAIVIWQRQGMPVRHLGRLVRFELDKVLEWFDERARATTAPHEQEVAEAA